MSPDDKSSCHLAWLTKAAFWIEILFRKYHSTEGKKLNSHANTPVVVKMNEINPKYENT
jgi:hypothetical protein